MSLSDDDIEVVYDTSQDESPLTEEQLRTLQNWWCIDTLYSQQTIQFMANRFRIPYQKIVRWDEDRRRREVENQNQQQQPSTSRQMQLRTSPQPSTSTATRFNDIQNNNGPLPSTSRQSRMENNPNAGDDDNDIDMSGHARDYLGVEIDDIEHDNLLAYVDSSSNEDSDDNEDSPDDGDNENLSEEEDNEDHPVILSRLHLIFPRNEHGLQPDEFANILRERILKKVRLCQQYSTLLLFVDSSVNGDSAAERLANLQNVQVPTFLPIWFGSIITGCDIRHWIRRTYLSTHWSYLRMFDIYKVPADSRIFNAIQNSTSTSTYRKQILLTTIKLLAARVVHSGLDSYYNLELINRKCGFTLLSRSLNHVSDDELVAVAQETLEGQISLLCPHLTTIACENEDCQHIIHLDQLDLVYEVDKQNTIDNRREISINLGRIQTFNLGNLFLPKNQDLDNQDDENQDGINEEEETVQNIQNFRTKLNGYRSIHTNYYVYIILATRYENKSQAPPHLNLAQIRNGQKCYLYVGRSIFAGMPLHHIRDKNTGIGRSIHNHRLNMFWSLRNKTCTSFRESEIFETLYQVVLIYVQRITQIPNLRYTNIRLESTVLDFLTDAQLQQLFVMMRQPGIQFIYDTQNQIPQHFDFGLIEKPLVLNRSRRHCL